MPEATTLYEWFDRAADRHGDHIALEVAGSSLTYSQLRGQAEAVAAAVVEANNGHRPKTVGLVANRSTGAYAGYLGILRAGATVIPLSPKAPQLRIHDIAKAAGLDLVVTDNASAGAGATLELPEVVAETVDSRQAPLYPDIDSDETAYVIFTSGSTGMPKGVPISHRNVCANLQQVATRYGIKPGSRASGNFDLTFDGSVHDLFVTWSQGGTLVVPSENQLLSPVKTVNSQRLTHWFYVPSVVSFAEDLGSLKPGCMPDLEWSLFAAEPVPIDKVRKWREAAPNSKFEILYGPTETTVTCTSYVFPAELADWPTTPNGIAPIGAVYPNLEFTVLDEDGEPADTGELCIRGPQRFNGYLDPADNAERFSTSNGAGTSVPADAWYRTGDRVARHDGTLIHLGRNDFQIKVRGFRIELGEIENVLRQQPGVRDAIVVAVPGSGGRQELAAAVSGGECEPERLHSALDDRLPSYMRPRRITVVDALPLNANGKIDRLALTAQLSAG